MLETSRLDTSTTSVASSEHRERALVEPGRRVDDDVGDVAGEQLDDAARELVGDGLALLRRLRAAEHVGARRLVAGEEDLQGRGVERGRRRQLADRVLGNQPEGIGGIAELHVEVDEGDGSVDRRGRGRR